MGPYTIIGILIFLGVVFTVLGFWHRSVQASEDRIAAETLKTAEAEGSGKALTQHPQIDMYQCMGCGSCVRACPEHGVLAVVEGKARLVHASHCVGHGSCEAACPVGALTVGLGDIAERNDIPQLSDEGETAVSGVFIAGELGGIGLIRHAILQGTRVTNTIAERLRAGKTKVKTDDVLDLLIVGCGPAGIASALRAHELGLNFAIVDQDGVGGSVRKYPRNKMTLTQPVELPVFGKMRRTQYSKEELIELWDDIFARHNIQVHAGVKFLGLDVDHDNILVAETSTGTFRCRTCVLALGRRGTPRKLNVPGEESERVLYQLIDAADYVNRNLLVVGGGDSAVEAALALATQEGNHVVLSYRRNAFFRIKTRNRERLEEGVAQGRIRTLLNSQVTLVEDGHCRLEVEGGTEEIPADYVFVMVGGEPPFPMLEKIGVRFGSAHQEAGDIA